jgi:glucosamine kinase
MLNKSEEVLVGVDGGGTYSRALCTDLSGNVLAYAEGLATNPDYAGAAHQNFRNLMDGLLASAGKTAENIVGLAAGLAGLDALDDDEWALAMTRLPDMRCTPVYVNDATVAHAGALGLAPGIVVIASTGSIAIAITARGETIRNYDFNHYAPASARFLAHEAVFQLLTRELDEADLPFLDAVLRYWNVKSPAHLREFARQYKTLDRETRKRRYGGMAPILTDAAEAGSPLAKRVCDWGAGTIADSICLLRTCFNGDDVTVPVAVIGAVGRCAYMYNAIQLTLREKMRQPYAIIEPILPPVCGAILLAARSAEVGDLDKVTNQLALWQSMDA